MRGCKHMLSNKSKKTSCNFGKNIVFEKSKMAAEMGDMF